VISRQRNARLEQNNVNADPEALLASLHAERETAAEEARRKAEQAEDDALVSQFFSKVPAKGPSGASGLSAKDKGKGKEKAVSADGAEEEGAAVDGEDAPSDAEEDPSLPSVTIKRRPAPGNGQGPAEPSVASLLAAKGKTLEPSGTASTNGSSTPAAQQQIKKKREGMQKLLGIKRKAK
jgi:hypothetical protein